MPETIKKRTLKVKAQSPDPEAATVADASGSGNPPPAVAGGGLYIPAEAPQASYTFAGILAILSTVMFIALLILQWAEYSFYKAPESVWPI